MSDTRASDVVVAFGIGMVFGAVTALLLAPATGEETRRRIGEATQSALNKAREGGDAATEFVKDQARRVEHAFQEGKEAYKRESAGA